MRIVYLNPTAILGGAERVLLDTIAAVRAARSHYEAHLIVGGDGPLVDMARERGAQVHIVPMPDVLAEMGDSNLRGQNRAAALWSLTMRGPRLAWAARRYAGLLRETVRSLDPALIHSNGIKTHLLTGLVAFGDVPVVWHIHDMIGARPVVARALRWMEHRAAGAIAISEAVANDVRQHLPGISVDVVYNAIDTERFTPGRGDGTRLDALAGLPPAAPGTLRVGLVATYARWKGHLLFLKAAAQVAVSRSQANRVRFYVIGGPVYRTVGSQFTEAELRAYASELGLTEHVAFVDFQRDIVETYRALDVVVHASTQPEPFGLTIAEAMACGRPTIVARAGGAAELFRDGRHALGFPPGDAVALAQAMTELMHDPERRARMAAAARVHAVERFARARLGEQIATLYDRYAWPNAPATPRPTRAHQVA